MVRLRKEKKSEDKMKEVEGGRKKVCDCVIGYGGVVVRLRLEGGYVWFKGKQNSQMR